GDPRATLTSRARVALRGQLRKDPSGVPGVPLPPPSGPPGARGARRAGLAGRPGAAPRYRDPLRTRTTGLRCRSELLHTFSRDLQHPRRGSDDPGLAAPGMAPAPGSRLLGPAPCPSQAPRGGPGSPGLHRAETWQGPGQAGPGRASLLSAALSL
uniref:Uncharacterized protein n=1 Tax=Cricetulus griseus TaxID=10029 RepID=A0A8C2N6W3_CRIGR